MQEKTISKVIAGAVIAGALLGKKVFDANKKTYKNRKVALQALLTPIDKSDDIQRDFKSYLRGNLNENQLIELEECLSCLLNDPSCTYTERDAFSKPHSIVKEMIPGEMTFAKIVESDTKDSFLEEQKRIKEGILTLENYEECTTSIVVWAMKEDIFGENFKQFVQERISKEEAYQLRVILQKIYDKYHLNLDSGEITLRIGGAIEVINEVLPVVGSVKEQEIRKKNIASNQGEKV